MHKIMQIEVSLWTTIFHRGSFIPLRITVYLYNTLWEYLLSGSPEVVVGSTLSIQQNLNRFK